MNRKCDYDILVIGGGHSGVEAAWIGAEFGLRVALVSLPSVPLGFMPCNPAIGGVGKGQVVRELDLLGGLMGRAADRAAIQYRTLNESKGFAVMSTRAQIDKDLYVMEVDLLLKERPNLVVLKDHVDGVGQDQEGCFDIQLREQGRIRVAKVVATTGTYLNGILHTGTDIRVGGSVGHETAKSLSSIFSKVKALPVRFKTGTPARLDKRTIDFSKIGTQPSDETTPNFHWAHSFKGRFVPQQVCHMTRTTVESLEIIRSNKERSPLFNGQIGGVGPRYCPSIEDKAFRYPDRNEHLVFLEPEGAESNSYYPNGLSTSLPKDVQLGFLRAIPGLEKVEILEYGYAVEYDVVDTLELDRTLMYKDIPGLYFAGQVNGTSGYEEAAAQGYIAGVNAALSLKGDKKLILDRQESYIGVMIEDLVTSRRDEPYRLFTARAENRLSIREDNTTERMREYRLSLNLKSDLDNYLKEGRFEQEFLKELVSTFRYSINSQDKEHFEKNGYGKLNENISMRDLLVRSQLNPVETLQKEIEKELNCSTWNIRSVAIYEKYRGYIERADQEKGKLISYARKAINWEVLSESPNVSYECRLRIKKIRPETFGQLMKIDGIRPATISYVASNIL